MKAIKNKFLTLVKLKSLEESISMLSNYSFKENLFDEKEALMNYIKNEDGSIDLESTELFNQIGILNDMRETLITKLLNKKSS
jgi:hypothetical protein